MKRSRLDTYIRRRAVARGSSSQEKKYVNLLGGDSQSRDLRRGLELLTQLGYTARVVPGPFLLATTGGAGQRPTITTMPLSVSSSFAPTKEVLTEAWRQANLDPADPDPDIDLRNGEEPKWSTHSLRRLADTVARRYREVTGVTEDEIDIYFGWHERQLLRAMQVHYATMSIRERMATARITGML